MIGTPSSAPNVGPPLAIVVVAIVSVISIAVRPRLPSATRISAPKSSAPICSRAPRWVRSQTSRVARLHSHTGCMSAGRATPASIGASSLLNRRPAQPSGAAR